MATPNNIANQPLRLNVTEKPTYWNKEAAIGTLLAFPIGTVIGAIIGKDRMQHELDHGKEIKEPTAFNKDMVIGGLLAPIVTGIAGFALSAIAGIITLAVTSNPIAAATVTTSGNLLSGVALLGSIPIGGYLWGMDGKETMQKEKDQAISQLQNFAMSQHFSKAQAQDMAPEIEQTQGKNFAAALESERAQAALAHGRS